MATVRIAMTGLSMNPQGSWPYLWKGLALLVFLHRRAQAAPLRRKVSPAGASINLPANPHT